EDAQAVVLAFHNSSGAQFGLGYSRAGVETTKLAEIDDRVKLAGRAERHCALAFAAQFRQTAIQRRLAAFKARTDVVTSVLAFLAAPRRFSASRTDTATNALFGFARALRRFNVG